MKIEFRFGNKNKRDGFGFKFLLMTMMVLTTIFCSLNFTVISTFYPVLAANKYISPTVVGIIFAFFEGGLLIFGPLIGVLSNIAGVRFVYVWSIFICAGSTFLFSFVNSASIPAFVGFSIAIRLLQGGSAFGVQSACITIATSLFPENLSKAVSIIEIANGVGYAAGPPIGGILYEISGFMAPFLFVSAMSFLLFLVAFCFTNDNTYTSETDSSANKSFSVLPIFKIVKIYVGMLELAVFTMSYVFYDIALSPFLTEQFGLNAFEIGLFFMATCVAYSVSGPIVGHLVDKTKKPLLFMMLGCIIQIISYLFIGPARFFNMSSHVWLVMVCAIWSGIGCSFMYVPVMEYFLIAVRDNGLPVDFKMRSVLAAVLSYGGGIGGLLGPVTGGILLENIGFQDTCVFIAGINLFTLIVLILTVLLPKLCGKKGKKTEFSAEDREPLLSNKI